MNSKTRKVGAPKDGVEELTHRLTDDINDWKRKYPNNSPPVMDIVKLLDGLCQLGFQLTQDVQKGTSEDLRGERDEPQFKQAYFVGATIGTIGAVSYSMQTSQMLLSELVETKEMAEKLKSGEIENPFLEKGKETIH